MNARFRDRGSGLANALLCHTMDGSEDSLSDRVTASWLRMGAHLDLSARSASYDGGGGMILNPTAARLLCAYGGHGSAALSSRLKTCAPDGSSWVAPGEMCRPGCAPVVRHGVRQEPSTWCEPSRALTSWCEGLPWRPEHVNDMAGLTSSSNRTELVVLDGAHFRAEQPRSVDAVFAVATDADGGAAARALHLGFLQAFPEVRLEDFPLLVYDPSEEDAPFRVADAGATPSTRLSSATRPVSRPSSYGSSSLTHSPPRPPPPPGGRGSIRDDPCDAAGGEI